MNLRLFDAPRRRPVPERYRCDDGEERSIAPRTVFIFIKSHCDGCAAFHGGFQTPGWEAVVVATDADGMIREGREIAAIDSHMVVKVPFTRDGVRACRTLASEGIRVNVTLIFSTTQAWLAASSRSATRAL